MLVQVDGPIPPGDTGIPDINIEFQICSDLKEAWQALFRPEGPSEIHIRCAKSSNGSEPTDRIVISPNSKLESGMPTEWWVIWPTDITLASREIGTTRLETQRVRKPELKDQRQVGETSEACCVHPELQLFRSHSLWYRHAASPLCIHPDPLYYLEWSDTQFCWATYLFSVIFFRYIECQYELWSLDIVNHIVLTQVIPNFCLVFRVNRVRYACGEGHHQQGESLHRRKKPCPKQYLHSGMHPM